MSIQRRAGTLRALVLTSIAFAACVGAQASTGWDALLAGAPLAQAEAAFKRDLDANASDAAAAYGLTLLQQAQGQREKAMVTALDGLRSAPADPLAFLLEDVVSDDATFNRATTSLVTAALPLMTERPDTDPLVRFNLRWLAYQLAGRSGDRAARMEAMRRAGFVPSAFFSKASTELSRTSFYEVGAEERGRFVLGEWSYSELEGLQCRPPAYTTPKEKEFNYYALIPFTVSESSPALLYFNASKSFRVVLDDKPLFTKDIFKVQEDPTAIRQVLLRPGAHRLLVKIHGIRGDEGVHIALLDARGNPLKVSWSAGGVLQVVPPAGFEDQGEWRGGRMAGLAEQDPRYKGFLALWHRWRGDVARGRLEMEDAAAAEPKCLAWNLWVARMYLLEADDLPDKIAQSRADKAVESALASDPDAALALYFKALLQAANSDSDDNLATLSRLVDKVPEDPRWFLTLASEFETRGWLHQARVVLESASSYHPACEAVESAWIAFYQRIPDTVSQEAAITRLAALRNADGEWEDYYRTTRQWADLHKLLETEIRRYGDPDRRFYEELAKLDMKTGDYASARDRLKVLVALDPSDVDYSLELANACFLSGDRAAAFKAWEKLKEVKPDAFQVDMGRWAMGEPLPFQNRQLDLAKVLAQDTSKAPEAAPSSLLLDQMFTRVQKDGSSIERYHGIIRVNNKEGVDRESEQSLPGQVILTLRTVKPDGSILEPEQIPDKDTVSMQGVEAGDIIEYEYITLKRPSGVKRNAYVTAQVYLFQDLEKPFHRTQWYLEWPDSIPMQFYEQNLPGPAKKGSGGGYTWRDWDYRDMPRIAPEPDTPNRMLFVPLVEAVGGIGWPDLGRYLKDGVTGAFQITPEIEHRYAEAVGDAKAPEEKLDKIISYLLKQVDGDRGAGWQDPTQTLLTRQGSRLTPAAAFLTLAHIPFDVLVAETVPDRVYREDLARIGQFSTPVLRVDLPGGAKYLTLGSPYRDPFVPPWYLQGARAMDLSKAEPWREVDIPANFKAWTDALEEETRELSPDGDLRIEHRQVLDPEAGESLRGSLTKMDKDQWRQAIQMALSKQYGNLDLLDMHLENMEDAFKPLTWDYTVLVHGYAPPDDGHLTVSDPLPALRLGQAFASLRERKLPLTTGAPIFLNQTFTLKLPPGATFEYAMPNLDAKTPFGSYRIHATAKDGSIAVERQVQMPYQIVWPPQYPKFASFMQKVDDAESGQLVVSVPKAAP